MSELEKTELAAMLDKVKKLPAEGKAYVEGVAAGMAIMVEKQSKETEIKS